MREIKFRTLVDGSWHYWWPSPLRHVDFAIAQGAPTVQFTGLKDENGKEMYEGDIVRFNPIDVCIGVVKFGEWENIDRMDIGTTIISGWFIQYDWHLQDGRIHKDETDSLAHYEVEVIGNIYENPDLLEQSNE